MGSDGVLIRVHGDQVRFTFILTFSFLVSDSLSLSLSLYASGWASTQVRSIGCGFRSGP